MVIKSNFPFDVKKIPFFYGWVIMLAGTVGIIFSIPGQTMGVSAFTDHLIETLHLSRNALSWAYLVGTASSSLLLTKAGKLWDQHGARIVASVAALVLGLFLFIGSMSPIISGAIASTFGFNLSYVGFVVIMVVFFGIRFSGQGVLTLVSRNITMKWFDRYRGLANGVSSSAVAYGFSIAPLILVWLTKKYTWQGAWQVLALSMLGFIVFAIVVFRDNPEDCGEIPDGKIVKPKRKGAKGFENRKQYTLKEAQRTWVLWIYTLTLAFNAFYVTGFTFHIESIFEQNGYDGMDGFQILPKVAYVSIVLSIIGNIVSDYIRLQYLLFLMIFGAISFALGTVFLDHQMGINMVIVGNGIMGGMFSILMAVSWPRFFGRKHLGAISGFSGAVMQFSSAIGPLFFSQSLALTGSYKWAGLVSLVYLLAVLVLAIKARNPQQNIESE